MAEIIYLGMLRLFPAKHRKEFAEDMLLHARDMNREAQKQGASQVAILCLRLVKDGILNACLEHWEGIMGSNKEFKPASWLIVMLSALPGLLFILTRRMPAKLPPLDQNAWYLYLGLLVIGVPLIWWRGKIFPVWALLPLGALAWFFIYSAGMGLSGFVSGNPARFPGGQVGIAVISVVVFMVISLTVLRGVRLLRSAWILAGVLIFGNLLLAFLFAMVEFGTGSLLIGMSQYFSVAGVGPLEGLLLVALGLLFARAHGVLAILVMVGGYTYMFSDSDYLFGYPQHDWTWLTTYFTVLTLLFLVVIPAALLRARSRSGQALAVFIPLVTFFVLRFTVPQLVIDGPIRLIPGEVIWVINILLSFVLAWVIFGRLGEDREDAGAVTRVATAATVE